MIRQIHFYKRSGGVRQKSQDSASNRARFSNSAWSSESKPEGSAQSMSMMATTYRRQCQYPISKLSVLRPFRSIDSVEPPRYTNLISLYYWHDNLTFAITVACNMTWKCLHVGDQLCDSSRCSSPTNAFSKCDCLTRDVSLKGT